MLIPEQFLLVELRMADGQPAAGAFVNFRPVDDNGFWAGKAGIPGKLDISQRKLDIVENPSRVVQARYTVTEDPTNHVSITLPAWFNE